MQGLIRKPVVSIRYLVSETYHPLEGVMADRKTIAIFGAGIRSGSRATRSQSAIHRDGGHRADPIALSSGRNYKVMHV
jgi:hypothetical protein